MPKTIIIQVGTDLAWTHFRKCCQDKGWHYQTLANKGLTPKIGEPVVIDGVEIKRIIAK